MDKTIKIFASKVKILAFSFFICYTTQVIGQINTRSGFQNLLPKRL